MEPAGKNMKWIRKGRICGNDTWDLSWHKMNTQMPIPYLIKKDKLRLYLTFCDEKNRGRLGYVDVDPEDPGRILGYSKEPLLDIGRRGRFDENGVVATCILPEGELIYLYYCGFQKHVNYPYSSLTGVAVSRDGGNSFYRLKETPLLERRDDEMFIRTGAGVYKFRKDLYRLYYAAGSEWFEINGKWFPKYTLYYIESGTPDRFDGKSKKVLSIADDEFGITSPQIIKAEEYYQMIYSVRSCQRGYQIGYAVSKDGIDFVRKDNMIRMDRPKDAFDGEMICYGKWYDYKGRTYLFYSGNHYGMDGIGWAELER